VLYSGNDNLHLLTSDNRQQLRIDMADFEGYTAYAKYPIVAVGSDEEQFPLQLEVGEYTGTAGM